VSPTDGLYGSTYVLVFVHTSSPLRIGLSSLGSFSFLVSISLIVRL
jgi:hypothetical protein